MHIVFGYPVIVKTLQTTDELKFTYLPIFYTHDNNILVE